MPDGTIDVADVTRTLSDIADPETGRTLVQMEQVQDIQVTADSLRLTVALTTHSAPLWRETAENVKQVITEAYPQMADVVVDVIEHVRPPEKLGEIGLTAKSAIAVGSGKGGVGKSTIAASLAYGLRRAGCRVGLMDADVYGPSIPHILGISGQPEIVDEKVQPLEKHGIRVMSMGFLVPAAEAVVWRGPMLHGAITQFLRDTAWGDLDYLIVDMPPGTGDIALTLSQLLPLTGAIVVCTPQDVAMLDAVKAIAMFNKVNIPLLGLIENMSGFVCPGCNERYEILRFRRRSTTGRRGGSSLLGEVPINLAIRERGDEGRMEANFEDPAVEPILDELSYRLVKNLATNRAANPPLPPLSVL